MATSQTSGSSAASASAQRDRAQPARVEDVTVARAGYPVGRMLVTSPLEVDAVVRRIPEGRVLTIGELRANLARNHRADYTCPETTATCLRIVAEAAVEERAGGKAGTAPWWRVVKDDGLLMDDLPGGVEAQARRLAEDGVVLFHLGKVPRVSDVEHYAWHPPQLGKAAGRKPPVDPREARKAKPVDKRGTPRPRR
jgi:alkylated DNA nucleotide flippase Atl1